MHIRTGMHQLAKLHVDRFLPPTPISISVTDGSAPDMETMGEEVRRRANQQVPVLLPLLDAICPPS
jgi:hypothetical protein